MAASETLFTRVKAIRLICFLIVLHTHTWLTFISSSATCTATLEIFVCVDFDPCRSQVLRGVGT